MENKKDFLVSVEKVIRVSLDMDKYQGEALEQVVGYWGFDRNNYENDQEILEEIVKDIALTHVRDGNSKDMEGFVVNGHTSRHIDTHLDIKEIIMKL